MAADVHGATGATAAEADTQRSTDRVGPEPPMGNRIVGRAAGPLVVLLVGGGLLAVGWDSGGYGLAARSAAGVAAWLAVLAVASVVPQPLARLTGIGGAACALLAVFALETGVSAAWGDSAELAVDELGRVLLFLAVLVLVLLIAARSRLSRWCDALAVGIVAVAVLALGSRLFPHVIHGLPPLDFLSGRQSRLAYPLGYWTALGVLVALAFPLLLRLASEKTMLLVRGLAVAPMPALAGVLYLSSARLAIVVAAVGVAGYLALSGRRWAALGAAAAGGAGSAIAVLGLHAHAELVNGPFDTARAVADGRTAALVVVGAGAAAGTAYALGARHLPRPPRIPSRAAYALTIAGAAAVAVGIAFSHVVARFDAFRSNPPGLNSVSATQHFLSGSSNGRWQLWGSAVHEFVRYPLLGHGAGSFQAWWLQHGSAFFVRNAHSLFLEQLGSLGIVGGLVLVGFFATPFVAAARALRQRDATREPVAAAAATLAAFVVAAALDWMWEMTVVALVGIVCAGILLRAGHAARTARPRGRGVPALAAAGAVLAAGSIALEGILVLATHDLDSSSNAAAAGDLAGARSAAHSASRLEPWAATPYLQLALVDEKAGDLSQSLTQIERALARDRADWQLWVVASRIERKLGDAARSQRSLSRARALNPHASG